MTVAFLTSFTVENPDGSSSEVYARRYDADGEALGDAFKVNDYISGVQNDSELQQLEDGRIVAVWAVYGS